MHPNLRRDEGKILRQRLNSPKPHTYFEGYETRLRTLAEQHDMTTEAFRILIEKAFGTSDKPPVEEESDEALRLLAKLRIGPCKINWLFQYHVV